MFPRHNGPPAISESFALNLIIFVSKQITICPVKMQAEVKFLSSHTKIN